MTTAASDPEIVLRESAAAPALRAADQGVADALESGVRPLRRHPPASTRPSGVSSPAGATRWGVPRQVYLPRIASNRTLPKGALHVVTLWRTRWGINKGRTQARRTRKSDLPMRCGGFS